VNEPTITIRAKDQLRPGRCCRCGGELGHSVLAAEWNGARFEYCESCVTAESAPPAICPTCERPLPVERAFR
jgi:hypothetical protein